MKRALIYWKDWKKKNKFVFMTVICNKLFCINSFFFTL